MIEEWKLIKEYKSNSTYYVKGDKLYVSNLGHIRLNNDIIFDYGKGLWLDKCGNIKILGCNKLPYKTLYRIIYALFNYDKRIEQPNKYQIHHIDYNHLNNSLDNLCLLSNKEHGLIHREDCIPPKCDILKEYREQRDFLYKNKDIYIERSKSFLKDRLNSILEKNIQLKKQEKIDKKNKILQERKAKLNSGRYKINKDGHLYSLDTLDKLKTSRIGIKESKETRIKLSNSIKQKYIDDPTYRIRVKPYSKNKKEK